MYDITTLTAGESHDYLLFNHHKIFLDNEHYMRWKFILACRLDRVCRSLLFSSDFTAVCNGSVMNLSRAYIYIDRRIVW